MGVHIMMMMTMMALVGKYKRGRKTTPIVSINLFFYNPFVHVL